MPLILVFLSFYISKLLLQKSTILMHLPLILISSVTKSGGFFVLSTSF
jgi:hypothetical protein